MSVTRYRLRTMGWKPQDRNSSSWRDPLTGNVEEVEMAQEIQFQRDREDDPERLKAEAMENIASALFRIASALKGGK